MPLPLLAHQAPILPLKLWRRARPAFWNGTALVVGSIAPDLEYVRLSGTVQAARGLTHSVTGQLIFCLPVTLAIVGLVGYLRLGEVLVTRVHTRMRRHVAWLAGAAADVAQRGGFWRASVSALVGSFSHVAFDDLTHHVLLQWLPESRLRIGHVLFSTTAIVQLTASLGGALVSLWLLYLLSKQGETEVAPSPSRPGALVIVLLTLLGAALGVRLAWPAVKHPDLYFVAGRFYVWGHVAFLGACGAAVGVLLALTILAAYDRRRATAASAPAPTP